MVHRTSAAAISIAFLAAGCTTGASPLSSLPPPAAPNTGKVAYAVGRFDPRLSAETAGTAGHAGVGALEGAGTCARGASAAGAGAGNVIGALFFLVCAPFGALIGAAGGAAGAATSEQTDSAEARIGAASRALNFPAMLATELETYARSTGIATLNKLADEGPLSAIDYPRYRTGPDYVIEIAIVNVAALSPPSPKLPYSLQVTANGRLVRIADNVVVDSYSISARTPPRTVEAWTHESTAMFRLRQAVSSITQSYVNEWLLIVRDDYRNPPVSSVKSGDLVPDYVLRPRDWPLEHRRAGLPAMALAKTITPVLSWEKLPATIPEEYFQGADPRARNLVYDVRVYAAATGSFPTAIAASHNGLKQQAVRITELGPCRTYYWTVRARFELDGRPRATEWSGAYNLSEAPDPRVIRRGGRSTTGPGVFFYPFRTPPLEGETCP